MKAAIWDTYVTKKDGSIMHFDIIVPEETKEASRIHAYGKEYLKAKGQEGQGLTSNKCNFNPVEMVSTENKQSIEGKGYYIVEREGC